jgi:hypothetical protein
VPRTGQNTCYDSAGAVITCAGTGQDGAIQAGAVWPDPRFSERTDGTVSDNLTGLLWAKDANLMPARDPAFDTEYNSLNSWESPNDGEVTWQHALDYVAKLNNENYLNHNDWRLPNVNELESLLNAQLYNPALPLNHPFTNVQWDSNYWSSTSYTNFNTGAFIVTMYGFVYYYYKTGHNYVWPVCSGQCESLGNSVICLPKTGQTSCFNTAGTSVTCSGTGQDGELQKGVDWPSPRFVDNGETVTDSLTGLEWTKDANSAGAKKTWQAALDYVKTLTTGSHSDWRLPNKRELRSLVDYSKFYPVLPAGHPFTNVRSDIYWSSTSSALDTYNAWVVSMDTGLVYASSSKTDSNYVWPVRAGLLVTITSTTTTTQPTTTTTQPTTTTTQPTTTTTQPTTTTTQPTTTTTQPTTTTTQSTTTTTQPTTTTTQPTTTTTVTSDTTTTTTSVNTGPCPATQALGVDNLGLENLRDFRDSRLAQSAIGRQVIQIYYKNADSINAALDSSPALRASARKVLEVVAPLLGGKEEK